MEVVELGPSTEVVEEVNSFPMRMVMVEVPINNDDMPSVIM